MAYQNGTSSGALNMLSLLSSFMTSNGWTLHDDLGTHDKVFFSAGTSGKQNHYVRCTATHKTIKFTSGSGTRTGTALTATPSGATATIVSASSTGSVGTLIIADVVGKFAPGDTLSATGWTATIVSTSISGLSTYGSTTGFGFNYNQYSVRLSTAAALPSYTASGSGPSKTLTATSNGQLSVDGYAVAVNDRILNRITGVDAGVYTVTDPGSGGSPFVLTRATDFNQSSDIANGFKTHALEGATLAGVGWILTNTSPTLESTPLVFERSGSGGFRNPADAHNAFDWLLFRTYTYWNSSGHAGVNEAGQAGPWGYSPSTGAANYAPQSIFKIDRATYSNGTGYGTGFFKNNSREDFSHFDGHRLFYGFPHLVSGNVWTRFDLARMSLADGDATGLPSGPSLFEGQAGPLVFDKVNDRTYYYTQTSTAAPNAFARWNQSSNSWEVIASSSGFLGPPTDDLHAIGAWDGSDFIYFPSSGSSTLFARYRISTNSWTTLATGPVGATLNAGYQSEVPIYIPAGNIVGIVEDVFLKIHHRASAFVERYNVTSNTWTTAATAVIPNDSTAMLMWDSFNNLLYYYPGTTTGNVAYIADLGVTGLTFTPERTVRWYPSSGTSSTNPIFVNHFVSKLRVNPIGTSNYHFAGDANSIVVASTQASGNTYWVTFGLTDSRRQSQIMTTSGSTAPGSPTTVSVDSTAGFSVGTKIIMLDPTSGMVESTTILSIPSSISFTCLLRNSFQTGSRAFVDAINCVVAGDSDQACFSYTLDGHRADDQGDMYRMKRLVDDETLNIGAPDVNGFIDLWPYLISNINNSSPTSYEPDAISTLENRSTLKNVFVTSNTAYPGPQVGTVVRNHAGQEYLLIENSETKLLATGNPLLAIGPIN